MKNTTKLANTLTGLYGCYDLMIVADAYSGEIVAQNTKDFEQNRLKGSFCGWHQRHGRALVPLCIGGKIGDPTWQKTSHINPIVAKATGKEELVMTLWHQFSIRTSGELVRVWVNFASNKRIVEDIAEAETLAMEEYGLVDVDMQIVTGEGLDYL